LRNTLLSAAVSLGCSESERRSYSACTIQIIFRALRAHSKGAAARLCWSYLPQLSLSFFSAPCPIARSPFTFPRCPSRNVVKTLGCRRVEGLRSRQAAATPMAAINTHLSKSAC
jgi:hypothetical protein